MNNQIDNIKSKTIKKLAQQCTTYHKVDFGMYEESGVDLEKFAKLIIKETLEVVRDEVQYALDDYLADTIDIRVKNHFGIK